MVAARAPQAVRCLDSYHLVSWVTDALNKVRRAVEHRPRRQRRPHHRIPAELSVTDHRG
ncbi:hypothetical protein DLJ46_06455 [Micromonospora globispora]|uniref:Transposase IS204/IS1001/IS1096/IS1165 DDE domain-containing protein n=1 Tax=Micromonospora globispora TaxID=1450148 RepID=A0A317KB74_9ACTN|nr:hypothetical protein DLJ46_06455 [Micromonospora globispora]RQW94210.1 hypothetical protein DKL51_16360 [Micromonospora globispora]